MPFSLGERIFMNERQEIFKILSRADKGEYVGHILEERKESENPAQEAFIRKVVFGVLDYQGAIDAVIDQSNQSKRKRLDPSVRIILRMAVYQMAFMDRTPHHAIVDEAVKLAKKYAYRYGGFVNGMLRGILRNGAYEKLKDTHALLPAPIENRLEKMYTEEELETFRKSIQEDPFVCVRIRRGQEESFLALAKKDGIHLTPSKVQEGMFRVENPEVLFRGDSLENGLVTIQDEGAATIVPFGHPQKGEHWLDLCAAPGGKTMQLAEYVDHVMAADLHANRVEKMEGNLTRGTYTNVETTVADATLLNKDWIQTFDGVLVDVPCSGLGLLRRKPDIRYHRTEEDFHTILPLQQQILENASQYVKPGGTLVYSTCTIVPEENEEQVKTFLAAHEEYTLEEESRVDMIQNACDGFYMARLRRNTA